MTEYRQRLIDGLAHVFEHEQKTLLSITIADIVAAAKVSKRTFYQHFDNKEQCFLALYEHNSYRILASLMLQLQQQVTSQAQPLVQQMAHHILNCYLQELLTRSQLMARLYLDILTVGQQGIEMKYQVLTAYAQAIHLQLASYEALTHISISQLLLFLSGVNELVLYHLNPISLLSLEDLQRTVKQTLDMFMNSVVVTD